MKPQVTEFQAKGLPGNPQEAGGLLLIGPRELNDHGQQEPIELVVHLGIQVATVGLQLLADELADMNVELRRRLPAFAAASDITAMRATQGLSQREYAELLGVDVRTLQNWEQGRRSPTGPAKVLLKIAAKHPEVLLEVA